MTDDLLDALTRFHREVFLPDLQRVVGTAFERFRLEMNAHFSGVNSRFNGIYERLDRLEAASHLSLLSLKRIEERLDRIEQKLERIERHTVWTAPDSVPRTLRAED